MKAIEVFKIEEKDKIYIGIKKYHQEEVNLKIESLKEVFYSPKYKAYVLPYCSRCYTNLTYLGFPIKVLKIGTASKAVEISENTNIEEKSSQVESSANQLLSQNSNINKNGKPEIRWSGKFFTIKLDYNEKDILFVKSLDGSYWSAKYKNWIAKPTKQNLESLQDYFNCWPEIEYQKISNLIALMRNPYKVEFYNSPEFPQKILVKVFGFRADLSPLKAIADREYDKQYKRWIIPADQKLLLGLIKYYQDAKAKVINRIPTSNVRDYYKKSPKKLDRRNHLLSRFPTQEVELLSKFYDQMEIRNYGWRTIDSYLKKCSNFLKFYEGRNVLELSEAEVNHYIIVISRREISESLQNIIVSALKLFYQIVARRPDFQVDRIERPKNGKYLPTILSTNEIDRMFRTLKNLKHIAILYTIYSGGMRLSEILNIRVQDVLWDRNQILIKSGKGNKDRITLLGRALKKILERYFDEFQPQYWLFEGGDKISPYSPSSVQSIVKKAARSAKIQRKVTPHTLRHCFATHLLDRGTDVRYIQELLGHKDIKTTLIYTHVTTRSLDNIISPLDRLIEEKL